jgi:mono/diheme cytochrome c family protein
MKLSRFLIASIGLALAGLAAGCATARRTEPVAPPLELSNPQLARGQVVFYQQCHLCHPHGAGGLGPALNNKPLPGFLMKTQVRLGLGAMPRFGPDKIPADDLDSLIAYLKLLHRNRPNAAAVTR